MKAPRLSVVVAEMKTEMAIVDKCIAMIEKDGGSSPVVLTNHFNMLTQCVARLSGNGIEPNIPVTKRTRKPKAAETESTL